MTMKNSNSGVSIENNKDNLSSDSVTKNSKIGVGMNDRRASINKLSQIPGQAPISFTNNSKRNQPSNSVAIESSIQSSFQGDLASNSSVSCLSFSSSNKKKFESNNDAASKKSNSNKDKNSNNKTSAQPIDFSRKQAIKSNNNPNLVSNLSQSLKSHADDKLNKAIPFSNNNDAASYYSSPPSASISSKNSRFNSILDSNRQAAAASASYGFGSLPPSGNQSAAQPFGTPTSIIDLDNPDPDVVRTVGRHLVDTQNPSADGISPAKDSLDERFSDLKLQGGDITREVYRWARHHGEIAASASSNNNFNNNYNDKNMKSNAKKNKNSASLRTRSKSFSLPPRSSFSENSPALDSAHSIRVPGGFRRDYIRHQSKKAHRNSTNSKANSTKNESTTTNNSSNVNKNSNFKKVVNSSYGSINNENNNNYNNNDRNIETGNNYNNNDSNYGVDHPHQFLANNFLEFLTLYGHFAGEELEDDDDSRIRPQISEIPTEGTALLQVQRQRRRQQASQVGKLASSPKAVLLLLKSFVGTGILFLPKAFLNGGLLFSFVVLLGVALISYYCMLLLIKARECVGLGSYGEIGGQLYGKTMRALILFSLVISQIGFAAAYIVFTAENLQAFILAVTSTRVEVKLIHLILLQLLLFAPLVLIRNISKLSSTALIADFFILIGLLYLFYYSGLVILKEGVSDVVMFNSSDWTLFIGTAIFTFEGIGLIIPIQESMKHPEAFPKVLGGVMVVITFLFASMGAVCYSAFGSKVQTAVLLNFPQDNRFVNGVQLLYSVAILLSTPLQLFPAIRIMENALFVHSGKYNHYIKWQKNIFRAFIVCITTLVAWGGADDLDRFVAIVGSFACIPLVYIYPSMLHYKCRGIPPILRILDVVLVFLGIIAMIYTTAMTLDSWRSS